MSKVLVCFGAEDARGVWHCTVCGQPDDEDCIESLHEPTEEHLTALADRLGIPRQRAEQYVVDRADG